MLNEEQSSLAKINISNQSKHFEPKSTKSFLPTQKFQKYANLNIKFILAKTKYYLLNKPTKSNVLTSVYKSYTSHFCYDL